MQNQQQQMNNGTPYFGEMPSLNQSLFNPAFNMMPAMPAMFADQFPSFPPMFDNPFPQQQNIFDGFSNGFSQQQQQQPQAQPSKPSKERIIPIQVVKSNGVETRQQNVSQLDIQ